MPVDSFVEHEPGDQVQPPVATTVWVTYNPQYLYVAFRCEDNSDEVRATMTERDRIWDDDLVVIILDTFGEQDWAYEIGANPYGIQGDLLWSSNSGDDTTYDQIFESAGQIAANSWNVEFAIPWTSLRFPDQPNQEWRVDFGRFRPRDSRSLYGWAKYDRDDPCWPCQWGTLTGITGVQPGHGLELLPSFVTSQSSRRTDDGGFENRPLTGDPGLSLSLAVSPTVNAEATLNPDFSQVESDAAQIDVNSTFALFFPEKRPFFQEGRDLWRTDFNLVYTRMINQPSWATKLTGRPGKSSFAVLTAQDETTPFIIPFTENSAMYEGGRSWSNLARYRRTLGEQSHLGLILTDRRHQGGGSGTTYGADVRLRLGQNTSVSFQTVGSYTSEPDNPNLTGDLAGQTFDRGQHTATFDGETYHGYATAAGFRRDGRHWNLNLSYQGISPTFRAENGFQPRNNQRVGHLSTKYTYYGDDGVVERLTTGVFLGRMWEFNGEPKDEWIGPYTQLKLRWAQTSLRYQYMHSNEKFHGAQFDHIFVNGIRLRMTPYEALSGGLYFSSGHRIARSDLALANEVNFGLDLNLKPHRRLVWENNLSYIRSTALDTQERLFGGYVARSRLNLQLSRVWTLRLVLQYDDFSRSWDADPLLTWRLNPLSIFYIGSTRHYATTVNPANNGAESWHLTDRTYFMKVQYLFQL